MNLLAVGNESNNFVASVFTGKEHIVLRKDYIQKWKNPSSFNDIATYNWTTIVLEYEK